MRRVTASACWSASSLTERNEQEKGQGGERFFFLLNIAGFEKKNERSQLFFKDRPISNLVARKTIPYRRVPWYWPKFL